MPEYGFNKIHLVSPYNEKEEQQFFTLPQVKSSSFIKVAQTIDKDILDFISGLKPENNRRYVLINALGAGEYYGSNVNGDFFPEPSLAHRGPDYGYKTFEMYGNVFRNHQNKDPNNRIGDIHLSIYNPRMHRVELVASIMIDKAPDVVEKIDRGEFPYTSMGSKNPYDVCSICNNKAKRRDQHCEHVRHSINKVLGDGRKVMMINPYPRFHDISQVVVPAEMTSRMLQKIASALENVADAEDTKKAEIDKIVPDGRVISSDPSEIASKLTKGVSTSSAADKDIDPKLLSMLKRFPIDKILATLTHLGIVLKPAEFQKLSGMDTSKVFVPLEVNPSEELFNLSESNVDETILKVAATLMSDRSLYPDHLIRRVAKKRTPAETNYGDTPELSKVAYAYGAYRRGASKFMMEDFYRAAMSKPALLALILGSAVGLHSYLQPPVVIDTRTVRNAMPIPSARLMPQPEAAALLSTRAYMPMYKNAASEMEKFAASYKIDFSAIADKIEVSKRYAEGLEKIGSLDISLIDSRYEEGLVYYFLCR